MLGGSKGLGEAAERHGEEIAEEMWLTIPTGHRIKIRTPGSCTGNRVTVIDVVEPPSNPPPFTRHDFIEIFHIRSGILTFMFLDEPAFACDAGSMVTVSSGRPHAFWNQQDEPVEFTLVCAPAGLDRYFVASHVLLSRTNHEAVDEISDALGALRKEYGLDIVAPAPEGESSQLGPSSYTRSPQ